MVRKMVKNKKAGIGTEWLFALGFIFALTIIVLLFNMIFNYHLAPTFIDLLPETDTGVQAENGIIQWLTFWKFIPFLLLGSVIIYMIILTVKKEPVERGY